MSPKRAAEPAHDGKRPLHRADAPADRQYVAAGNQTQSAALTDASVGSDHASWGSAPLLQLQRDAGNRATARLVAKPGSVQRENGNGAKPKQYKARREPKPQGVPKRKDHEDKLDAIAAMVIPGLAANGAARIVAYLAHGLGKGGVGKFRSKEVKAFRKKMLAAARYQAYGEILGLIDRAETFTDADMMPGPAMKEHVEVVAKSEAHKGAEEIVDARIQEFAETWVGNRWPEDEIISKAGKYAKDAAWNVYSANPKESTWKASQKAAEKDAKESIDIYVDAYLARAKLAKNKTLKPEGAEQQKKAVESQQGFAGAMAKASESEELGSKSLAKAVRANTTEEGIGKIGKLLDQAIPLPGESVSFEISLSIPTGSGVNVLIKVMGKAGRGTTGFTTSGVTQLGNKKRLEVMAQFSLGVGAEAFGLKADFSVSFFARAGSDTGTQDTMRALSYGSYRAASAKSKKLGWFWSGSSKGNELSSDERAEMWAAAIEEQAFAEEDSDDPKKNAFADIGVGAGGSAGLNVKDVFSAELGAGGEVFKRYDATSLEDSLKGQFGAPTKQGKEAAKKRRKAAKGKTTTSFGVSASLSVSILGQDVAFGGSLSMENDWDQNVARDNWGVEITAGLANGPTGDAATEAEKWAVGIVNGGLGIVEKLMTAAKKKDEENKKKQKKTGAALDIGADIALITDAGLDKKLTDGIGKAWGLEGSKFDAGIKGKAVGMTPGIKVASTMTAVLTFGKARGKGVARVEIRSAKGVSIDATIGGVGLTVAASKGRRLFAFGYEDKSLATEVVGRRPPTKKIKK